MCNLVPHLPSFKIRSIHFSFGWSFWEFFTNVLTFLKGSHSHLHIYPLRPPPLPSLLPPTYFLFLFISNSSQISPNSQLFFPTSFSAHTRNFYIYYPPLPSPPIYIHTFPSVTPLSLSLPLPHPFLHFRVNFSWILNISTPIAEKEGINKKHKWCTDDRGGGVKLASVSGNGLI